VTIPLLKQKESKIMKYPSMTWKLPTWVDDIVLKYVPTPDVKKQMLFVVNLSRVNVDKQTGGPFAAAVFDVSTGALVAPGVNMVIPRNCSHAHAEMVALALAEQVLESFTLGAGNYRLVTSCEPCAMCAGAIPWSGVKEVAYGATSADAESIGFDEGCKPPFYDCMHQRDIFVYTEVERAAAAGVLAHYGKIGQIYNG
jgi:tRNA(Arg) A34 adenosine deaminase TadA